MIEISEKYKKMAERIISREKAFSHIKNSDVKIVYLVSDKEKMQNRKIVFADCKKVDERYKWCCDYDFMITVYEQNCIHFNRKQYEILLRHELHHVGIDEDGLETTYYNVPHDIEEFWDIIKKYGLDWEGV